MNDALIHHADFARWELLDLVGGSLVSLTWSWRFRRLARTAIRPDELRWEAWRGVAGAVAWIVALLLIALLMHASAEIRAVEVVALVDEFSPALIEQLTVARGLILTPVAVVLGGVVLLLAACGLWSGALAALRGRKAGS